MASTSSAERFSRSILCRLSSSADVLCSYPRRAAKGENIFVRFSSSIFGCLRSDASVIGFDAWIGWLSWGNTWIDESNLQSVNAKVSRSQFDTLECSLEELAVLELIAKNPMVKQQELAAATRKSLSTVKRIMRSLQEKSYIRRESGKRYGKWEVLVD